MRKFQPGARVRVEVDAQIVEQADRNNPYWYVVRFVGDGHEETVNLARIVGLADVAQVSRDSDGSVMLFTSRLTPEGALHLRDILTDYVNNPMPGNECTQDESEG